MYVIIIKFGEKEEIKEDRILLTLAGNLRI